MKKLLIIMISILTFIVVGIFLLYIFNFNISRAGMSDKLRSVKESKEYDVFVSEYYSSEGYILYPDNQKLYIKESWIEHSWVYDYWLNADSNCRDCKGIHGLNIVFEDPIELNIENQNYYYQWKGGESGFDGKSSDSRGPLYQISIGSNDYKNDDTLKVYITKYYPETKKDDTVSSFILIKKK